ncbi:hypothetical protein CVE27_18045 [Pseudomonas syringae pv. actinidiae]|nr:hypothetical protein [Pseudomonas syringae pv. actinidiae]
MTYRATLRVAMSFRTLRVLFDDAERHPLHSDAGACATIISTIVRRSASCLNTQSEHPPSARCSRTECSPLQHLRR